MIKADKNPPIGYLIPQFPGQTHIFFWREIMAIEASGTQVKLFSTRMPAKGLISHNWSDPAISRTRYLGAIKPLTMLRSMLSVSPFWWGDELRRSGFVFLKDLLVSAAAARLLFVECKKHGISHVHVHSCGRAALIAALAKRMGGPDYSITLHGPLSDYGAGQHLKWQGAKFATVITRKLLDELPRQLGNALPERLVLQPMGVDTQALTRPYPYIPAQKGKPIHLFSCGRLNVVKGHQDLLSAVRILLDQGHDIQLDIAGQDDDGGDGYHQTLAALLKEKKLENHVRLLGAISSDSVRDYLLKTHIFVLASWHEPLGVAYMEAMSCGVPTVGTNAGGVPELITNGQDGLLVAPKNPGALADIILSLINNSNLANRLGAAGRERIVTGFDSRLGAQTILAEIAK
jgi:glycosyltransferase involved in cell wall biosynthesis